MRTNPILFSLFIVATLCSSCLTCASPPIAASLPKVSSGHIERLNSASSPPFFPASFASKTIPARNIDVWLPENYAPDAQGAARYRVLYLLDGQMLFDASSTWNHQEWQVDETASALIAKRAVKPFIVVGIWNAGDARHAEYFPQKPFAMLTRAQQKAQLAAGDGKKLLARAVYSDAFLRFLTTELKPEIDRRFATKTGASDTFIAGSSMGGLLAWYALSEYPKVFGGAGCLSTHWPGGIPSDDNPVPATFFNYLSLQLPKAGTHRLWFDHGTETLDALYPKLQLQADAVIRARGYVLANWKTTVFPGQDHSEKAWSARLDQVLIFLMH